MSGSSVQILAQAHAYIEAGNLEDAENLIRSLLEQDPDNTDAWWLLAHSVRDATAAREALDEVLRLDPNDQQARSLLSALDDRFPSGLGSGGGRDWQLSRPRFSRPRMPSLHFPGGFDDYSTPVSYLVLVILLIAGGWLMLRYFGIELNLATPTTVPDTEVAQAVEATAMATMDAAVATGVEDAGRTDTVTSGPGMETQTAASLGDSAPGEATVAAAPGGGQTGPVLTPAPVSPAPAVSDSGDGSGTDVDAGMETPVPLPTVTPVPVPTFPFPVQTDPAEFTSLYLATYAEAGLQLAANSPLLESSQFGSVALASVCLHGSLGLRSTVNEAMELMSGFAAQLLNSAPALGVKVLDCANEGAVLRIVAAPLQSALEWGQGTLTLMEFQASWEAVS
ncbi:MAG: tetratricopeptide repeat protein [Anaerolineaceae bacterium]|nr:tetratricopeptide repeat protein [Anaerolineaceae bacterium]